MRNNLEEIIEEYRPWLEKGKVASYIPELAKADAKALGVWITNVDGTELYAGDVHQKFTIQSISKVITLIMAMEESGPDMVFTKVGMEPTEFGFNSITNLEVSQQEKPLNPMINAGAIAVISLIKGDTVEEKTEKILNFTKLIAGNDDIKINMEVYKSESETGDRNRALAYFMKGNGTMEGNVEEILDIYFKVCSMEVTCRDIARIGAVLANDGVSLEGERLISKDVCRIVKTIMVTCGMYDASGKFAVHIGIPAKSGVGGGILAAVPKKMGIGLFGPALDNKGNSIGGIKVLEELSKRYDLSIF